MAYRRAQQLELPGFSQGPSKESGDLWKSVETLPERAEKYHRTRRKLVKPKLRQRSLLDPPEEPTSDDD